VQCSPMARPARLRCTPKAWVPTRSMPVAPDLLHWAGLCEAAGAAELEEGVDGLAEQHGNEGVVPAVGRPVCE